MSLSACIFSVVASELGYHDKAYHYFIDTARMDLDDYDGNVRAGVLCGEHGRDVDVPGQRVCRDAGAFTKER